MKKLQAKPSKNILLTIVLFISLIFASATVLADPGQNSTLVLDSGILNGEAISPSDRTITVTPGQTITGDITVTWDSAWNPDYNAPLGYTPTWGDHETSYFWDNTHAQGTGTKTFTIDTTAPTTEGTYHLIFAYRAEIDGADVFSMTNWANNPEVWNDGNDIASLSSSQINTANNQGNLQADVLFDSGMQSSYLPATAVEIRVIEEQSNEQSMCYQHFDDYTKTCEVGEFRDLGTVGGNPRCHLMRCEDAQGSKISEAVYCEVPDETGDSYFEIHWFSGDKNNTMCVEDECLEDDETYERSPDFRTCAEGDPLYAPNPTAPQVSLETHSQFPVDFNNVFWCNAEGFEPTSYDWDFGDGTTQTDALLSEIWHKFPDTGEYTVTCTAKNNETSVSATTTVNIETPVPASFFGDAHPSEHFGGVYVTAEQQDGLTYQFSCDDVGFRGYIKELGWEVWNDEGFQHRFDTEKRTVNYTLPAEGNYTIYCNMASPDNWYLSSYWNSPGGVPNKRLDCPGQQVCLGADNFLDFTATNETDDEEPVCHSTVTELPATCNGGTIVTDENSGSCRTIECSDDGNALKVLACDKPNTGEKTHFEMYRQSSSGTPPEICIAETCIQSEGYKRSTQDYPICTEEPEPEVSADIQLVEGFPYDHNYAFECNANFNATNYTFDFGDGSSEETGVFDVYHTYALEGSYTATCTATNGENTASDSISVNVQSSNFNEQYSVLLEAAQVSSNTYEFTCEDVGFGASYFGWKYPGHEAEYDYPLNRTFTHTFSEAGNHTVICRGFMLDGTQSSTYYEENHPYYHDEENLCRGAKYGDCEFVEPQSISVEVKDDEEPVCAESIGALPATCKGGTFTTDNTRGSCRTLVCEGSGSSMQVLACDKPDGSPEYFEMYKQSQSGNGIQEICLADSCITNGEYDGYERGEDYPVCTDEPPSDDMAQVVINEPFSKDHNYVFHCEVDGFEPTHYEWDFGDGDTATRNASRTYESAEPAEPPQETGTYQRNNAWHTYENEGNYNVSCKATDGNNTAEGETSISVQTLFEAADRDDIYENQLVVEELGDKEYRVTCNSVGFEATGWRFIIKGATEPWMTDSNTRVIQYNETGPQDVVCISGTFNGRWSPRFYEDTVHYNCEFARPCVTATTKTTINVTEDNGTSVDLRIKEWYPQGRDYVFVCEESGYEANSYFWNFGDGYTQTTNSDNVYHTYRNSGDYEVMCEASNGATESDSLQINVE